ncbi:MAG: hypothetical protein KGJ02_08560 [Verrucomicrobiota bacterium]|nr:hypothetical protein [Verrucomicrobiota bacterium]
MTISQNKRDQLLRLIAKALDEIQKEIEKANRGLETLDELEHLECIQSALAEMNSNLNQNNGQKIQRFQPNIARIVIDTWPLNNPLGDLICQIEYEYKKLKRGE